MALPVAAAVFALSGCGGDDDNPVIGGGNNNGSPSITACFTANNTVSYAVTTLNAPSGSIIPTRDTVGPMTYNGQAVTGQTVFYSSGTKTYTTSNYWTVTNSGVTMLAEVDQNGNITTDDTFYPQNMEPGQVVTDSSGDVFTFIGFETLTLAGKTFSNTCHINGSDTTGDQVQAWYAPGYGIIKRITNGNVIAQYNGTI